MQIDEDHDGPYPLIPLDHVAVSNIDFADTSKFAQWFSIDIALTHNVIIRGLNSIWLNAPLLLPGDDHAFVGYALSCVQMIRWHHEAQEKFVFPCLQLKVDMRQNMAQHLRVDRPLRELEDYLMKVQEKKEDFDSERVLELRRSFGAILVQHLHDEIQTVSSKSLYRFSKEELLEIHHSIEEHKAGFRDSATLFPFLLTGHDKEYAPGWPILPSSVRWFVHHVGPHIHGQYWKFAPFSMEGVSQAYPPHEHHEINRK